jgi:putative protease
MNKPRLLAPVSSFESTVGVVSAGAEEIYCAVKIPGAEHILNRPEGCCVSGYDELGNIAHYAHSKGVDTVVTLELPFLSEFMADQMREHIASCAEQDIDAWIIGDLGLVTMVQEMELDIPIYASTYFVAINYEAVDFLKRLGVKRVVLDRHMTIREIRQVVERSTDVEIEVFIHGSGCSNINYNCYLEGGRRNLAVLEQEHRGTKGLPTPCRTPFDVYEVGGNGGRIARAPVLDAYTFCSLCKIPELIEAGVTGLKIVGRCLPTAYQVKTTDMYRRLVDQLAELDGQRSRSGRAWRRRVMRLIEPWKDEPFEPVLQHASNPAVAPPSIRETLCGEERCYFSPLFHVPYRSSSKRGARGGSGRR